MKLLPALSAILTFVSLSVHAATNVLSNPEYSDAIARFRDMPPAKIGALALVQLDQKHYLKLEGLAAFYRSTKQIQPDGGWNLKYVYSGLVPSERQDDKIWKARLDAITNWISACPESVTARVAWANVMTDYAWKARGSDWAKNVTEVGWKLFRERLVQASAMLDGARGLDNKCPQYWSVALTCALGQQPGHNSILDQLLTKDDAYFADKDPELKQQVNELRQQAAARNARYDALFKQAVQAEPSWSDYYFQRAIFFLPRWHGIKGQWQKDLKASADEIGGEKGDILYARVVWSMDDMLGADPLTKGETDWDRVHRGLDLIQKQFPEAREMLRAESARLAQAKYQSGAAAGKQSTDSGSKKKF